MYKIGEKIWFRGDEVTITTEPYMYCGGEFQYAVRQDGKTISVATPRFTDAQIRAKSALRKEMQEGFSRLRAR